MKIRIGVVFGGKSVEHEVSIISAVQAMSNIDNDKYDIVPIYITKNLEWYTGAMLKDIESYRDHTLISKFAKKVNFVNKENRFILQATKWFKREIDYVDLVLPVVHGANVEDGTIQGYLEMLGVPYVGSNVFASAIGQDKVFQKQILHDNGLPVTDYVWFFDNEYYEDKEALFKKINALKFPVIVKPATLGSSIGISKVNTKEELVNAIDNAITYDTKVLIEEMVDNLVEVNQAVLGTYEKMITSEIEEVIKEDEILSYKDKYIGGGKTSTKGMASLRRILPARLEEEIIKKIDNTSKQVFKVLNNSGVARIDYLFDKNKKKLYINEINTIPGSLSYYLWEGKNIDYTELLDNMINIAIKSYKKKSKMTFSFESNILENYKKGIKGIKK